MVAALAQSAAAALLILAAFAVAAPRANLALQTKYAISADITTDWAATEETDDV